MQVNASYTPGQAYPNTDDAVDQPRSAFEQMPKPASLPHFSMKKAWHERAIRLLDACETKLDKILPNCRFQIEFDQFCERHQNIDHPFNHWLKDNGQGAWYEQLGLFLAKLPLRAARNILSMMSNLIQAAVAIPAYALMHPIKAPLELMKILVRLIEALTQPETWSRIGFGIMGSALAQGAFTSNPVSVIAVAIGAALAIAGVSLGTLKAALIAHKAMHGIAVKDYLLAQAQQLTEDFTTGFCTGMLLEAVHQVLRGFQKVGRWLKHQSNINTSKNALAHQQAREFLDRYNYPSSDKYWRSGNSYNLYWHMERGLYNRFIMEDLPGAHFSIRDLQVDTRYITTYTFIGGGCDAAGNCIPGEWVPTVTAVPVYDKFFGYTLPLVGWVEPPMPPLGAPIRLNEAVASCIGLGSATQRHEQFNAA